MLNDAQKSAVESLIIKTGDHCIFPYFKNLQATDISYKDSKQDPVSIADQEAEDLLHKGLVSILPDSLFIGEELYAKTPEILDHLSQPDRPVWVVDPIDGTNNFIAGKEGFGIMCCLIVAEEILSSFFYEICKKKLTVFHKGDGITINHAPIRYKDHTRKKITGTIGKKLFQFPEVQTLKIDAPDISLDIASQPSIITYHRMLEGELDFLIYKITYPWDHLPGLALLSNQGAVFNRWDGTEFQYQDIYEGLVVARNQTIMAQVMTQIITPLTQSPKIANMRSFVL
ncbi:MAG: inositol monophosphatase family protein [Sneathiella sp.]|uniref:inositol monophosphatase family protein n=1 Tax=Sneathiella sp. TaxID=1964365 RepID=UPI003002D633